MSMFFLSDPTLVIQAGINYCIGEGGFGTQLSPNPANGQPITDGPYAPFPPPASNPGLSTFKIDSGTNGGDHGYSDGTQGGLPVTGTLLSGGGTGGATLNAFVAQNVGIHTLNFLLLLTGAASAPPQNAFNSVSFIDQAGTPGELTTAGAGGATYANGTFVAFTYSTTGNTAQWQWEFFNPIQQVFTAGDDYTMTVA